jgi:hypothetical protein
MSPRAVCSAAPLLLAFGCAAAQGRDAALGGDRTRAAMRPAQEAPVLVATAMNGGATARSSERAGAEHSPQATASSDGAEETPPDKTLVLLSALGAMVLVVGRGLRRER